MARSGVSIFCVRCGGFYRLGGVVYRFVQFRPLIRGMGCLEGCVRVMSLKSAVSLGLSSRRLV